ncbi:hypothetical protein JHK87_010130 [Glycine soja]|nr:hypothetical protein JHK87_010130 [Glycine soja]
MSGMYFHGAHFSNYEAWLSDPTHIRPSAQVVWPIVSQEILNALMLFAGWFHYHKAAPKLSWFQDVESMLNHHLTGLLGFAEGATPFFTLNWSKYAEFLTFRGGLDPVTGAIFMVRDYDPTIRYNDLLDRVLRHHNAIISHLNWRGYWQELIESIVWAHNKLKVAPATQPRALSIVQGRAVGVTHYLLGGIATTWAFFLARIIAVG